MTTKDELKQVMFEEQNGLRAISGLPLPDDVTLFDIDRYPLAGSDGGKYVLGNVRAVLPQAHRDIHENEPSDVLTELRTTMREYRTWIALRNKIANHFLAYKRRMGELSSTTQEGMKFLLTQTEAHLKHFKNQGEKQIKRVDLPIVKALLGQKGIGPIYAAEIITTLDPTKASTPSAFWSYVGYAGPSKDRYTRGEKGGGNKAFRSVMFNLGMNFIKNKNEHYEPLYRQRRAKTESSQVLVFHKGKMANGKSTSGKEIPWSETNPGRRHLDAIRWMLKQFLADLWRIWREIEGLPVTDLYVANHLGHKGVVLPEERGWSIE